MDHHFRVGAGGTWEGDQDNNISVDALPDSTFLDSVTGMAISAITCAASATKGRSPQRLAPVFVKWVWGRF